MLPTSILPFRPRVAERSLLQEGRLAGPMPWVISIMMFLTALAAAFGLALGTAARSMQDDLSGKLTVQIVDANPVSREFQKQRVVNELQRLSIVISLEVVSEDRLKALLDPWLGSGGLDGEIPVPAMIDVELGRATPADIANVRAVVSEAAPGAKVNQHLEWLAPVAGLIAALKWLAGGLVALMTIAMAATVVLAARSALNTHKSTIDVMHLLGSTDSQIAALFQRRIALDALLGGIGGLIPAILVIVMVGGRVRAIGSDLSGSAVLGWSDWAVVALLPLVAAALATVSARLTVLRALRRNL